MKINILIVEDHELTRFGLKTAFEDIDFIETIYEASSAEEALEIFKNNHINVVIMDLGLPNMNGIEATQAIHDMDNDAKIIILTSHNDEKEVLNSLKAGANAYCSKEINLERLVQVVQSVADGAAWFDPSIAHVVLQAGANSQSQEQELKYKDYDLTAREAQILKLMTEGHSNMEIAQNEITALIGPSGCGKSTTLYMISGLQSPTSGEVWFGDQEVTNLAPEKRGIGLVFQNYALYPHMSIYKNIEFPLTNLKVEVPLVTFFNFHLIYSYTLKKSDIVDGIAKSVVALAKRIGLKKKNIAVSCEQKDKKLTIKIDLLDVSQVIADLYKKNLPLALERAELVSESSDTSCRIASPSCRICSVSCSAFLC